MQQIAIVFNIYGADDADPHHIAQALGFVPGEPTAFDDLDGYDSDNLVYEVIEVRSEALA